MNSKNAKSLILKFNFNVKQELRASSCNASISQPSFWAPELLYSAVYHLDVEILINSGWCQR